jgi:hypothetical protein
MVIATKLGFELFRIRIGSHKFFYRRNTGILETRAGQGQGTGKHEINYKVDFKGSKI